MLEVRDKVLQIGSFAPVFTIKSIGNWVSINKYEVEFYEKSGTFPLDNYRKFIPEYTPENIKTLKKGEIFVFGSNTGGRHGAGAALFARERFGAIYGQGQGLQGQSYAIATLESYKANVDASNPRDVYALRKLPLPIILDQVEELYDFANKNPQLKFYVTKIGVGLAGFSIDEIQRVFVAAGTAPVNIVLPKEFDDRYE